MRAEEAHQAEAFGGRNADPGQLDRLLQAARDLEDPDPVRVGPADVVDAADLSAIASEARRSSKPPSMSPSDGPVDAPRIEGVTLDVPGADGPRERERLLGERPRLLEPAREHQDLREAGERPGASLGGGSAG